MNFQSGPDPRLEEARRVLECRPRPLSAEQLKQRLDTRRSALAEKRRILEALKEHIQQMEAAVAEVRIPAKSITIPG